MLSMHAQRVQTYLSRKGYNTARETAQDCGLDEVGLDAALADLEAHGYRVHKGVRRESYGHEVLWITTAPAPVSRLAHHL